MPLKTLLARTTAVLLAAGFAAGSVIVLEPAGPAAAGGVAPRVSTVPGASLQITGTVTSAGGLVSGDAVSLLDSSGNTTTTATTQANGTYTVTAPQPGTTYYEQFAGTGVAGVNYQTQYLGGSQVAGGSQTLTLAVGQSITAANATLLPWNTVQPTVTTTITTGPPAITIVQPAPATTVTLPAKTVATPAKTVTTPTKTVTVTKTVTTPAETTTTPTSAGSRPAPSVVSGSLGGIGAGAVALRFTVDAGVNTGGLKSFEVTLPKGFTFVSKKLKSGLTLGRLNFTYKLSGDAITVTLRSAQKTFSAAFGGGAITTTAVIARHAKLQKIASEKISLTVTDARGTRTAAPFVIAKPS